MGTSPKRTDIKFNEFRKLLEAERARLTLLHHEQAADIRGEMADATENELAGTGSYGRTENEDTAAIMADRDRETALGENALAVLRQIEHALDKIVDGTYGICEVTGQSIPVERLRAIPWATMTVAAAALRAQ